MEFYLVVGLLVMNWGLLIWLARRCDSFPSDARIRTVARAEVFAVIAAVESIDGPRARHPSDPSHLKLLKTRV